MRTPANSFWLLATLFLLADGCAGGEGSAVVRQSGSGPTLTSQEKSFNPSAFNPPVSAILRGETPANPELATSQVYTVAPPETLPGFRVQVLLTQEIDRANGVFDTLNQVLEDEWVYVVYDSPYYKVRVGNYTERSAATPMLNLLAGHGYRDAWIVPDNVLKDPPPRLSPELLRQERPVERRW